MSTEFWVGPHAAPDTFRLVSMLGGGGEGEVWRGVLPLSAGGRRTVAVKIVPGVGGPEESQRWDRFGHVLRSISHPGLVRVTDVFTGAGMHPSGDPGHGDWLYVVMDHVEGPSLRDWVVENPGTRVAERLRMLRMIASALDVMHSGSATTVPVAHGDVKPANIVVTEDRGTVLVDLGLARLADGAGVSGHSAPYAAPELRTRGALPTPEADRYAFAVTVAQVLTGVAPPLGADGWLDVSALDRVLRGHPLTARRHRLVQQILDVLTAPSDARPPELRRWLDAAVESLSQLTDDTPAPAPEPRGYPVTERGATTYVPDVPVHPGSGPTDRTHPGAYRPDRSGPPAPAAYQETYVPDGGPGVEHRDGHRPAADRDAGNRAAPERPYGPAGAGAAGVGAGGAGPGGLDRPVGPGGAARPDAPAPGRPRDRRERRRGRTVVLAGLAVVVLGGGAAGVGALYDRLPHGTNVPSAAAPDAGGAVAGGTAAGVTQAGLPPVAGTTETQYLSDHDPVESDGNASGVAHYDRNDPHPLNGITYGHSVTETMECGTGDGGDYWVDYTTDRRWASFTTTAGLGDDSSATTRGSWTLLGDGVPLASGPLALGRATPVDVPVRGVLRLRLALHDDTAVSRQCPADHRAVMVWGDPTLAR